MYKEWAQNCCYTRQVDDQLFHQIKMLTTKLKTLNYPVEIKRWTKEGEESATIAVFAAQTSFD